MQMNCHCIGNYNFKTFETTTGNSQFNILSDYDALILFRFRGFRKFARFRGCCTFLVGSFYFFLVLIEIFRIKYCRIELHYQSMKTFCLNNFDTRLHLYPETKFQTHSSFSR